MEADRETGKMPPAEAACFNLLHVPPHSGGNNAFFFLTGAERGDSGYLEIAGIFKSQDINTDIRLLWPLVFPTIYVHELVHMG